MRNLASQRDGLVAAVVVAAQGKNISAEEEMFRHAVKSSSRVWFLK